MFRRNYADLAVDLMTSLNLLDGEEKLDDLFEQRRQQILEVWVHKNRGKTLASRVHEVTQLLSQDGYMATWEKVGSNSYLIKEMNCPVSRVAKKFPQLCMSEEVLLAELLQAKVSRQQHLLNEKQYCSYLVEEQSRKRNP